MDTSMRGLVVSSAALGKQWTPWFAIHRMQSAAIQAVRQAAASPDAKAAAERRMAQLDWEWDVERTLAVTASALASAGLLLSKLLSSPGWAWFSLAVGLFLLTHAVTGFSPPLPLLRALGFRTVREIQDERMALRVLRGDFAFAAPGRAPGPRGLADAMAASKERTGSFVDAASAKLAGEPAGATTEGAKWE